MHYNMSTSDSRRENDIGLKHIYKIYLYFFFKWHGTVVIKRYTLYRKLLVKKRVQRKINVAEKKKEITMNNISVLRTTKMT